MLASKFDVLNNELIFLKSFLQNKYDINSNYRDMEIIPLKSSSIARQFPVILLILAIA